MNFSGGDNEVCSERLGELRIELKLALANFSNKDNFKDSGSRIVSDILHGKLTKIKERDLILAVTCLLPHRETKDLELFIVEDKENIIDMFLCSTINA